jgi:hypothetical protein
VNKLLLLSILFLAGCQTATWELPAGSTSYFRLDYWDRILDALQILRRKFYATRHTLITEMVKKGINLKVIADYCGTSVAMIEQNYCAKLELDPDSEKMENQEVIAKSSSNYAGNLASPTGFEPALA